MSTILQYSFHTFTLTLFIDIFTFLRKITPVCDKNKLASFKFKPTTNVRREKLVRTRHSNALLLYNVSLLLKRTNLLFCPPN